jgi:hypothetical protein
MPFQHTVVYITVVDLVNESSKTNISLIPCPLQQIMRSPKGFVLKSVSLGVLLCSSYSEGSGVTESALGGGSNQKEEGGSRGRELVKEEEGRGTYTRALAQGDLPLFWAQYSEAPWTGTEHIPHIMD